MTEIIPAIIAQNFKELEEKIEKVEPYVDWAQLDIMDGQFVGESTWPYAELGRGEPSELVNLKTKLNLEAHLMVEKPEEVIEKWIDSGVKRIVFHYEATDKQKKIIGQIKKGGLEVGLAVNPSTPIGALNEYIAKLDLVLMMTVEPGKGGQGLLPEVLVKIRELRQKYPDVRIGADGGINLETAPSVIRAGADILAVGSAIFDGGDIGETIKRLKHAND